MEKLATLARGVRARSAVQPTADGVLYFRQSNLPRGRRTDASEGNRTKARARIHVAVVQCLATAGVVMDWRFCDGIGIAANSWCECRLVLSPLFVLSGKVPH